MQATLQRYQTTRNLPLATHAAVARLPNSSHLQPLACRYQEQMQDQQNQHQRSEMQDQYLIVHAQSRSEEHTSELQSLAYLVCRLLLEKKKSMPHTRLLW